MSDEFYKSKDRVLNSIQSKHNGTSPLQRRNNCSTHPRDKVSGSDRTENKSGVKWNFGSTTPEEKRGSPRNSTPPRFTLHKNPLRRTPCFLKLDKLVSDHTEVWIHSGEKRVWISTYQPKTSSNASDLLSGVKHSKLRRSIGVVDLRLKAFSETDIPNVIGSSTVTNTCSTNDTGATPPTEPSRLWNFFWRNFYRRIGNLC